MPHILHDVHVDEVSLVERGADQDADVVLFKSAEAKEPVTEKKGASMADLNEDLQKALDGVEGIEGLSPELVEALNTFAASRSVEEVAPAGGGDVTTIEAGAETDPVVPAATVVETVEVGKSEETSVVEDITKTAAFVDMAKRLEAAEVALAKARDEAEVASISKTLKDEASSLSLQADDLAKILHRVGNGTSTAADRDEIIKVLSGASKVVDESGMFKEQGDSLTTSDAPNAFSDFVAKMMTETPSLSKQAAISKALDTKEGKELYRKSFE